jgi:transcriptional regulator with XRE-family HTH domain
MKTLPLEVTVALQRLGANIRLARIRRQISQAELARASQMTVKTLYELERGAPGIAIHKLFNTLWALGLLADAAALANPDHDDHGKTLELARSPQRVRAPVQNESDF